MCGDWTQVLSSYVAYLGVPLPTKPVSTDIRTSVDAHDNRPLVLTSVDRIKCHPRKQLTRTITRGARLRPQRHQDITLCHHRPFNTLHLSKLLQNE